MQIGNAQILGGREEQQDYMASRSLGSVTLALVADGMGGYQGGAIASELTVKTFLAALEKQPLRDLPEALRQALQATSQTVQQRCWTDPALADMGATLVAAAVRGEMLHWISVGDSPLYLWRQGRLQRLNANHAQSEVLLAAVARGEMTRQEAEHHPEYHMITSAICAEPPPLVDCPASPFPLRAGDRLLLASDGIHSLTDGEIARLLGAATTAQEAAQQLCDGVEDRRSPNQDNTTALTLFMPSQPSPRKPGLRLLLLTVLLSLGLGLWWTNLNPPEPPTDSTQITPDKATPDKATPEKPATDKPAANEPATG